jgi:hypothetical protein
MTLNDIIEAYNDAEREYAEGLEGHYIIAKTVTPKSLGAYKEFKVTLYLHIKGQNLEKWSISETFKVSGADGIKSCWEIMEKKALVKFIKWCKGWN